jgi:hypothetical protein
MGDVSKAALLRIEKGKGFDKGAAGSCSTRRSRRIAAERRAFAPAQPPEGDYLMLTGQPGHGRGGLRDWLTLGLVVSMPAPERQQ